MFYNTSLYIARIVHLDKKNRRATSCSIQINIVRENIDLINSDMNDISETIASFHQFLLRRLNINSWKPRPHKITPKVNYSRHTLSDTFSLSDTLFQQNENFQNSNRFFS